MKDESSQTITTEVSASRQKYSYLKDDNGENKKRKLKF